MSETRVIATDEGSVRVLTLSRPEKKNAFDVEMAAELWAGIEAADADESVRVIAVTAEGDYFSAGVDVTVFLGGDFGGPEVARIGRLFEPLRACEKPTVAIVQGHCVGMGVTMLPHFDLVYAADHVTFTTPFVRLGLVVEYGGAHTLSRLIGRQRTKELLLRAAPLDATTAANWGLVTRTFIAEQLRTSALQIATEIAEQPAGGVRETLRLVDAGVDAAFDDVVRLEDEALASRYGSEENVKAVQAILSRKARDR